MNASEKIAMLFMDDQFADEPVPDQLQSPLRELRTIYDVDTVTTLQEAMDSFRKRYYRVFILDIDMRHQKDKDPYQDPEVEGEVRGTSIARQYVGGDNGCAIVYYSGAATCDDLIRGANLHAVGFVSKSNPEKLPDAVAEAIKHTDRGLRVPMPKTEGRILIVQPSEPLVKPESLREAKHAVGHKFSFEECTPEELPQKGKGDICDYAAIVVAAKSIDARGLPRIKKLCDLAPRPHTILLCEGDNKQSLTNALNARPFRLINIKGQNMTSELASGLKKALHLYDAWETFTASAKYVQSAADGIDWATMQEIFQQVTLEADDEEDGSPEPGSNAD